MRKGDQGERLAGPVTIGRSLAGSPLHLSLDDDREAIELIFPLAVTDRHIRRGAGFSVGECLPEGGDVTRIYHRHVVRGDRSIEFACQAGQAFGGFCIVIEARALEVCIQGRQVESVAGKQEPVFAINQAN